MSFYEVLRYLILDLNSRQMKGDELLRTCPFGVIITVLFGLKIFQSGEIQFLSVKYICMLGVNWSCRILENSHEPPRNLMGVKAFYICMNSQLDFMRNILNVLSVCD